MLFLFFSPLGFIQFRKPKSKYIFRGVGVRVVLMTAGHTIKTRLRRSVFFLDIPASVAGLARVRRVDFHKPLALVLQLLRDIAPTICKDRLIQSTLGFDVLFLCTPRHALRFQILEDDDICAIGYFAREHMRIVVTDIFDFPRYAGKH